MSECKAACTNGREGGSGCACACGCKDVCDVYVRERVERACVCLIEKERESESKHAR